MDYSLVLRALDRHVGITQRSLDFFRERRLGKQFHDAAFILDEAQRAIDEVRKMREFHQIQKGMFQAGMGPPPNPVPEDTSEPDTLPRKEVDFPDKALREPKS